MIPHEHVIGLSLLLFLIGLVGFLVRRNLIVMLMSIELMLGASNLAFVATNPSRGTGTKPNSESVLAL